MLEHFSTFGHSFWLPSSPRRWLVHPSLFALALVLCIHCLTVSIDESNSTFISQSHTSSNPFFFLQITGRPSTLDLSVLDGIASLHRGHCEFIYWFNWTAVHAIHVRCDSCSYKTRSTCRQHQKEITLFGKSFKTIDALWYGAMSMYNVHKAYQSRRRR